MTKEEVKKLVKDYNEACEKLYEACRKAGKANNVQTAGQIVNATIVHDNLALTMVDYHGEYDTWLDMAWFEEIE